MDSPYIIVFAIVLSLVLTQLNLRLASPMIAIADHWIRWCVFALGSAEVCRDFALIDRPYWVLTVAFFLLWFVGETAYNWIAIAALSVSPLPLFPNYTVNESGEEWPVQPRLLRMREWLRAQGFRQVQALRLDGGAGIRLRASVYEDPAGTTRIQVTFLPQSGGAISVCSEITSLSTSGDRYVTDNLYIPFAGFYPENWFVERRPRCRSLPRLLRRHQDRLATARAPLAPFQVEPVVDSNTSHRELDRLNTELGFLHPRNRREDLGKITQEGKYRVWKEIWTLKYLGCSARYR